MAGKQMEMTGAEMVLQALKDNGVEHIFGYPGGAVLPIYDETAPAGCDRAHPCAPRAGRRPHGRRLCPLHRQARRGACHLRSRRNQCGHRPAGRADGFDPAGLHHRPGPDHADRLDAFQECDTVGITRPCTKHNWLVKDVNQLSRVMHEAFRIATTGRPGPVVVDIPKDVQFATGIYTPPSPVIEQESYQPKVSGDLEKIRAAIELMAGQAPDHLFGRRRDQFRP
jgi:acetolactate synthase-1/2/3 large subunit